MKASTLQVAGVISHGGFPQPHGNVDRTLISRVLSGLRLQRHLLYTGRSSLTVSGISQPLELDLPLHHTTQTSTPISFLNIPTATWRPRIPRVHLYIRNQFGPKISVRHRASNMNRPINNTRVNSTRVGRYV